MNQLFLIRIKNIRGFKKQKEYAVGTLNIITRRNSCKLSDEMLSEDEVQKKSSEFGTLRNKIEIKLKQEQKELKFYEKNSTCSTM